MSFAYLKPGDKIVRLIAGSVPMTMVVDRIESNLIHMHGGWTFDVNTGAEVDEDLGWGNEHTGSFLVGD